LRPPRRRHRPARPAGPRRDLGPDGPAPGLRQGPRRQHGRVHRPHEIEGGRPAHGTGVARTEGMALRFGLFSINAYACSRPEVVARVAKAAEAAGFESLWGGEHVVLPDPQAPPSPMAPDDRILDPVIALTYCAAVTTRVRP